MKKFINILLTVAMTAVFAVCAILSASSFIDGDFLEGARWAVVPALILAANGYFQRKSVALAVVSTLNRFSSPLDNNSFAGQGIKAATQIYEAVSAWVAKPSQVQIVCYAQLTGNMTINATVTNMLQFSEVIFFFDADATQRVVTFGSNFLSSGTLTIPINKGAVVRGIFDGTSIRIMSREIYA